LARRYLTKNHRDHPAEGCALAALATEAARSDDAFRAAFEEELRKSLQAICSGVEDRQVRRDPRLDEAIALMALCVGGLSLSRAVADNAFSERVLRACADAAGRLASNTP